jgi:transposase
MIPVRQDKSATDLRRLAPLQKAAKTVLRLLGIAHILDGRGRAEAAALVGLEPLSLARAVKRYNAEGIAGLQDRKGSGRRRKLTPAQNAELKRIVLAGPEDKAGACTEFRLRDIVELIEQKWGVRICMESVRTRLRAMKVKKLVCRPLHHKADPAAQAAFKAQWPDKLAQIAAHRPEAKQIEIWAQDETRIGQKAKVGRRWAEVGSSPRAVVHGGFKSVWLFGAFCPERDIGVAILVGEVSTEAMSAHLAAISQAVLPGNHGAVLVDNAGFHAKAKNLVVPSNLTLVPIPAHSPELSPGEEVWHFLKAGPLLHRVYRTMEEIMDGCCAAWRWLIGEPGRIRSLCSYPWLNIKPAPT